MGPRRKAIAGRRLEVTTPVVPLSFCAAAEIYLRQVKVEAHRPATAKRISTSFASLRACFGETPVAAIDEEAVEQYKAARRCAVKDITLRHDLHALGAFFRLAVRRPWCRDNPMEEVKLPSGRWTARIRVLTAEEEKKYLAAALKVSTPLFVLARLMLATGMRPAEALALRAGDVDVERRSVKVREGKTAAARRTLQLTGQAADLVVELARGRQASEYLFPGKAEGRALVNPTNQHVTACEAVGFRFRLYDLRHTFATRLAEKGVPLPTLAAILGHSGLRCVMIYVHPSQRAMDEALLRWAG